MTMEIKYLRLHNQQISSQQFTTPAEIVSWFGAIQSQDFAAAKWAIALRSKNLTETAIEKAFNEGKILRTHIMRPTWHFVTPTDIRWILALTSPRVHKFNGYYYRQSGLDKEIFQKSNEVIRKALTDEKQLTREELNQKLNEAKIPTENLGLSYIIMQAELDGIIASGPRRGKQFTYMLLDERAPQIKQLSYEEAVAELVKRYFQSHGPALVQDFSWWSGLKVTEARKGIELNKPKLTSEKKEGKTFWFFASGQTQQQEQSLYLIPGFDEYFIAYKDRSDILEKKHAKELNQGGGMINGAIVSNGQMIGSWKRKLNNKDVVLSLRLFESISQSQQKTLEKEAKRFGSFVNLPVVIQQS